MTSQTYVLTTERLGLRPYVVSDAAALFEVFADPYAAKFYPTMSDPEQVRKWIEWNLRNYEEHGFGLWAVELLESRRFVGDAGLTLQPVEGTSQLEIGYHMHQGVRGKGFASEAAQACLDFGFLRVGANFICSIVHPENVASTTVARRVHSSMREFQWHSGPSLLYFTTEEQWKTRSTPHQ
jgi:RimJ/RimL family protein N-acetyltransferase